MIRKYLKIIHCNKNLKISKLISYMIQFSSFLHDSCEIFRDNQSKSTELFFFKMMKQKILTLAIADPRNYFVRNKIKKCPMFNRAFNAQLALIFYSFNKIKYSLSLQNFFGRNHKVSKFFGQLTRPLPFLFPLKFEDLILINFNEN